jgi:hypothetical protein
MPGLGAHPHRLAHLPGAQRPTGIGQHLHHVPVGHRQPAPIPILAEDRNLHANLGAAAPAPALGSGSIPTASSPGSASPASTSITVRLVISSRPSSSCSAARRSASRSISARNASTRARAAASRASKASSNDPIAVSSSQTRGDGSSPTTAKPPTSQLTQSLQQSRTLLDLLAEPLARRQRARTSTRLFVWCSWSSSTAEGARTGLDKLLVECWNDCSANPDNSDGEVDDAPGRWSGRSQLAWRRAT